VLRTWSATPLLPSLVKLAKYPARASQAGIVFDLSGEWSMQQAIAINEASLPWDGIENMTEYETLFFTYGTKL
jgi:hypothetical protein